MDEWCDGVVGQRCELVENANSEFMVCRVCGRAAGPVVDTGAEWRRFSADDMSKVRVVSQTDDRLAPVDDLSAAHLCSLADETQPPQNKRRKKRATGEEKAALAMRKAFALIGSLCTALELPQCVVDTAKDTMCDFRRVWDHVHAASSHCGSSRPAPALVPHDAAAVCVVVHAACAAAGLPLTFAELAKHAHVARTKIAAARRRMRAVHPHIDSAKVDAAGLTARAAARLALPYREQRRAQELASLLARTELEGRPPTVSALAALYLVAKHQKSFAYADRTQLANTLGNVCFLSTKTARSLVETIEASPSILVHGVLSAATFDKQQPVHETQTAKDTPAT